MELTFDFSMVRSWVGAVALSVPRLLMLFLVVPFLSGSMIPGLARNGVVLTFALFVAPMIVDTVPPLTLVSWGLALKEALVGLLLGLGFGIFIWAIQSVGDLVDFMTGSSNAAFFDPAAGHENGPTGEFLSWLTIALFVASGGLQAMFAAVLDSYTLWPVGAWMPELGNILEGFAVRQGDTLFQWIVKLGAPVLLILLLVEIGLGLVGREAQQLNVFFAAQPVKSLIAAFMMLLWLQFVFDSLRGFLLPENGVLEFLRSAMGK
ncbi:type III secretion system export apparatus subunit SctT [Propionivibrio soli]|uniref:type III secretion system export apparatus subunit SctT n=1 Tax=Propionivibrio soli TaxID=2976531 RepID=UPI0021E78E8F|nr:type III secretion system export apparatus subunit SctT [Propionivibrio soli]